MFISGGARTVKTYLGHVQLVGGADGLGLIIGEVL